MAFVVLYDACVLYPAPLRDLLLRLANTGIVRALLTFGPSDGKRTLTASSLYPTYSNSCLPG